MSAIWTKHWTSSKGSKNKTGCSKRRPSFCNCYWIWQWQSYLGICWQKRLLLREETPKVCSSNAPYFQESLKVDAFLGGDLWSIGVIWHMDWTFSDYEMNMCPSMLLLTFSWCYYVSHDFVLGTWLKLLRQGILLKLRPSKVFRGRTFLNKNVARQLIPDECWIYARKKLLCVLLAWILLLWRLLSH